MRRKEIFVYFLISLTIISIFKSYLDNKETKNLNPGIIASTIPNKDGDFTNDYLINKNPDSSSTIFNAENSNNSTDAILSTTTTTTVPLETM